MDFFLERLNYNFTQGEITKITKRAFSLLKTATRSTCASILLNVQTNFFEFQAKTERDTKETIYARYVYFIQIFRATPF